MAKRIKDIPTTITSPAVDDYLAVDGATNGTRKILATNFALASSLGTMASQAASGVAITGGAIDGTTIGGTTRAAGAFTNVGIGGSANAGIQLSLSGTLNDSGGLNRALQITTTISSTVKFGSAFGAIIFPTFSNSTWPWSVTYGIYIETPSYGVQGTDTHYQLYLRPAPSVASTKYGIYQEGSNDLNYFQGKIQAASIQATPIGSITPSTGAFTTLSATTSITENGNRVATLGKAAALAIVFGF